MHVVIKGVIVFFGLGVLFLGLVFLIAGGTENVTIGAVMVLVSLFLLGLAFLADRGGAGARAGPVAGYPSQPGVDTSPGGPFSQLVCPYCGNPVERWDVKPSEGGLSLNCSHCHQVSRVEEDVRW